MPNDELSPMHETDHEIEQFVLNAFYDENGHCIGCSNVVCWTGSMPYTEQHESYCRVDGAVEAITTRMKAMRAEIESLKWGEEE